MSPRHPSSICMEKTTTPPVVLPESSNTVAPAIAPRSSPRAPSWAGSFGRGGEGSPHRRRVGQALPRHALAAAGG
jgi:hypothetical protein